MTFFDLSTLDGNNGFILNGIAAGDGSGRSVSGVGDVNGDGIDDLIVGDPEADANGNSVAGQSYVVFGNEDGFPATLNLSALNGENGFRMVLQQMMVLLHLIILVILSVVQEMSMVMVLMT